MIRSLAVATKLLGCRSVQLCYLCLKRHRDIGGARGKDAHLRGFLVGSSPPWVSVVAFPTGPSHGANRWQTSAPETGPGRQAPESRASNGIGCGSGKSGKEWMESEGRDGD